MNIVLKELKFGRMKEEGEKGRLGRVIMRGLRSW